VRPLDEHRRLARALGQPLPAEPTGLDDALGRVLARDVRSTGPLPAWDNSAMDGYAVRAADVASASPEAPVRLPVALEAAAAPTDPRTLPPGSAARIMTGAPVPAGADAVVPVEQTDGGTQTVELRAAAAPGACVRRAGSDVGAGDLVLTAGTLLGPGHVAALAAVGLDGVPTHRRPRVAVLSTGDELVPPGRPLRHGQLHDSNSWLLAAQVRAAGGEPVRMGPAPDDVDALRALLRELDGTVDAVVTSGGVSMGAYDVVKAALVGTDLGADVELVTVAVQPGKPQALGRLPGGTPFFGLPGNPVSTFATFELFVRPALQRMRGLADPERPALEAVADEGWSTPAGRAQVMPVRWVGPGRRRVAPASPGGSGSHLVARLALLDALAVVPADVDRVEPGDTVTVLEVSP